MAEQAIWHRPRLPHDRPGTFFRNLPGLAVRSGLHTGEIESKRDEICGIAMHTVTRDGAMAEPSETLVSKIKG